VNDRKDPPSAQETNQQQATSFHEDISTFEDKMKLMMRHIMMTTLRLRLNLILKKRTMAKRSKMFVYR
jgi:hypothetical protein